MAPMALLSFASLLLAMTAAGALSQPTKPGTRRLATATYKYLLLCLLMLVQTTNCAYEFCNSAGAKDREASFQHWAEKVYSLR